MVKFVTCLNCMDGRLQLPLINYLRKTYKVDYVDMITEAGMDGFIVKNPELPESLLQKIDISMDKHGSRQLFIVGHSDCGGHPVDEKTHRRDILEAVDKVKAARPECRVAGLWASGSEWSIEKTVEK